ncbi:MAG: hypothetical protein J6C87_07860 [Bacteroides sp.]|nr:hypothetical protein [Bacteroides sp.]
MRRNLSGDEKECEDECRVKNGEEGIGVVGDEFVRIFYQVARLIGKQWRKSRRGKLTECPIYNMV